MDGSTLTFVTKCPNGHFPRQIFDGAALRRLQASGRLRYYCGVCGESWSLGVEERAALRSLLRHRWRLPQCAPWPLDTQPDR